jgi:hypothetical protein
MNIKEHIEAGHYPKDDKGRAIVPLASGHVATITATDKPGNFPIFGWYTGTSLGDGIAESWSARGHVTSNPTDRDLLPPPPRKVKVTAWALFARKADEVSVITLDPETAANWRTYNEVVEMTGEYEEPWS